MIFRAKFTSIYMEKTTLKLSIIFLADDCRPQFRGLKKYLICENHSVKTSQFFHAVVSARLEITAGYHL